MESHGQLSMEDHERRKYLFDVRLWRQACRSRQQRQQFRRYFGRRGVFVLNNDGSVTNTANGEVTATGEMPSTCPRNKKKKKNIHFATISGIYVTGPSGAGMSAISITNAGVVDAADGYGIGLGASGSVNNSGNVTGGEDGVVVLAGVGKIENSGSITATLDDGVGLFQGGTVTNALGASISGVVGVDAAGIFTTGGEPRR